MIRQASEIPNYTVGFSDELLETFRRFTAEANPAHLSPYLRPGLRVLDFGCGPGIIVAFIHRVAQMWFLAPEIMERRSGTSLLAEICAMPQPTPMTGGRNTPALMYGVAFGEAVANKPYHAGNADPQAKAE